MSEDPIRLPSEGEIKAATQMPESERWLAAHIITAPESLAAAVTKGIGPSHFVGADPRRVYGTAYELFRDGNDITEDILRTQLRRTGRWENLGGETPTEQWWSQFKTQGIIGDEDEREATLAYHCKALLVAKEVREQMQEGAQALDVGLTRSRQIEARKDEIREAVGRMLEVQADSADTAYSLGELAEQAESRIGEGEMARMPTGFWQLDQALSKKSTGGLPQSRVSVIGGRQNEGKSLGADWIMLQSAMRWKKHGEEKVAVKIDLENEARENDVRLLTMCCNADAATRSEALEAGEIEHHIETGAGFDEPWKEERFQSGLQRMKELSEYVTIDAHRGASPTYIRARLQAERQRREIGLVVVDYIKLLEIEDAYGSEAVDKGMTRLHNIAGEVEAPLLLVSQLGRQSANRPGGVPTISDLQWSSALEQQAATVFCIRHLYEYYSQQGRIDEFPETDVPEHQWDCYLRKNKGAGVKPELSLWISPKHLWIIDPEDPQRRRAFGDNPPPGDTPVEDDAPF